ncbi:MAG: 50S ribosomal protein L10 [Planctomycetes bacterium]|nr:50S ribosomal protein L10 [Planctomycetota bacterium]
MSKPVKNLLKKAFIKRLEGVGDLAVVSVVGIDGNTNNRLRGELKEKQIRLTVIRNAMARQAFEEIGLSGLAALLEGPCALAYGGEGVVEVVREIFGRAKTVPQLAVKGACMDGEVFGSERVVELSKYPTRIEALGILSRILTTPGANLLGAVTGPGRILAGILKSIEENKADDKAA